MSEHTDDLLREALQALGAEIIRLVSEGKAAGRFQQTDTAKYRRQLVDGFSYTESGVSFRSVTSEILERPTWSAALGQISEAVKASSAYGSASAILTTVARTAAGDRLLDGLTVNVSQIVLESTEGSDCQEYLKNTVAAIIKHVKREPLTYKSVARLMGVSLLCKPLALGLDNTEISLRATTLEDLQTEQPWHELMSYHRIWESLPSAILTVKLNSSGAQFLQEAVEESVAILRLFRVGGVRYISYDMEAEFLPDPMVAGSILSGGREVTGESYVVREADLPHLAEFWRQMSRMQPPSISPFSATKAADAIGIAYQRYSDSLLISGTVEQRISTAMMGLEALFLRGAEKNEIGYRLRTRVAKVWGLLGRDPNTAVRVVSDAYEIRSAFVHGDVISAKARRAIERRHGDFRTVLRALLEQLRVTIVLHIILKLNKNEWLDLLDGSLVDRGKSDQVEAMMKPGRDLLH